VLTLSDYFVEQPHIEWFGDRPFAFSRLNQDYAEHLEKAALSKEEAIKSLPVTPGWETAADTSPTTARFSRYSAFIIVPATLPLFFAIRETYLHLLAALDQKPAPRFIQCWYNIHRIGQSLPRHQHVYPFIGTFSAYAEGSETRYGNRKEESPEDAIMPHRTGQLVITTGKNHYHDTSTWTDRERARVTYAFDIADADNWNSRQVFLPFDFAQSS
jgi:hypothetical protein